MLEKRHLTWDVKRSNFVEATKCCKTALECLAVALRIVWNAADEPLLQTTRKGRQEI